MRPTRSARSPLPRLLAGLAIGCLSVAAQRPPGDAAPLDPYTRGSSAAMAALGYCSFGPFPFGTNHTTQEIEALLPRESLLWLETQHFRIGAALPAITLAGPSAWQQQQRRELTQLAEVLPNCRPDTRQLDPWLRMHLIAQRVERLYRECQRDLGRSDSDFPAAPGHDPRAPEAFFGLGPHLGMPEKFTILLLRESASLSRYTAAYHAWAATKPTRFHDHQFGTAWFGAALESDGGRLRDDEALCAHLTFHVAHNLYTSYRAYGHNLPAWLVNGLAYVQARAVSPRIPIYDLAGGGGSDYANWERRAPQMAKAREFEPLPRFLERMDVGTFTADDHLQCWALVDWLLSTRRAQTMALLHRMKDPFHDRMRFPTNSELFERQRLALQQAFGVDAAGLELSWRRNPGTRVARR